MLRLKLRTSSPIPVEAECLTPGQLAGKSAAEIAKLPVQHGNRQESLGEFFTAEGDTSDQQIHIDGDCSRVKWIGAGMTSGRITLQGDAGMHLGSEMRGGEIVVHGNAGDWVGAEMRGGTIHLHGNAGDLAGAAYRGSRLGMRGGVLLIDGNVGSEVGVNMRRGLIAIGGSAGDYIGASMIAGTIFVFGQPGARPGAGMKRGTLGFFGSPPRLLPTFRHDCEYRPPFLPFYLRHLRALGFPIDTALDYKTVHRFSGDLVGLGKGEILIA